MAPNNHHHRAGALKQSNKKNKRSKASKRSQSRLAGGKVETSSTVGRRVAFKSNSSHVQQTKANRRHQQQQKRQAKHDEALRKRRGIIGGGTSVAAGNNIVLHSSSSNNNSRYNRLFGGPPPPRVVGIISLGRRPQQSRHDDIETRLRNLIIGEADWTTTSSTAVANVHENVVTAKFDKHKRDGYLTILTTMIGNNRNIINNSSSQISNTATGGTDDDAVFAALDLCRVCDVILFVIDVDATQDGLGNNSKINEGDVLGMSIGEHNDNDDGDDGDTVTHRSFGMTKSKASLAANHNDFDHLISECGDRILSAVKSQGLPEVITVLARTSSASTVDGVNNNGFGDDDDDDYDDHMTTQSTKSAKSVRRSNLKRKTDVKKYISRFANTEFGANNDKVMEVSLATVDDKHSVQPTETGAVDGDLQTDDDPMTGKASSSVFLSPTCVVDHTLHCQRVLASSLVRVLCSTSASPSNWVSNLPRSYMLAESHSYSPQEQELNITGYVRGLAPFDVNSLVHVPGIGTYACKSLRRADSPLNTLRQKKKRAGQPSQMDTAMVDVEDELGVIESDPMKRESLDRFATPDALEGEQNLVGFDEIDEDQEGDNEDMRHPEDGAGFARPAGWSDYQSAWLDAVDQNDVDHEDFDNGELAKELNTKSGASVATKGMDLDDANDVTPEERRALIEQRRKLQQEHQEFPDEVQLNDGEKARERFARYRSLKSFKKSYWDPKENLPESYASIFNFSSFKTTQRAVMAEMRDLIKESENCGGVFWNGRLKDIRQSSEVTMDDASDDEEDDDDFLEGCIPSGSYITLTLEGVDKSDYDSRPTCPIMTVVSLLPHENKASVLHMGLSSCKDASSTVPVKSKDNLIFRCGWRTWTGRPVFSQNNLNCDKHKFERFMPDHSFFAASVFGPVTYTPCPVLVFREIDGRKELVASGSMIGADADRIVVKRIILTGYPVRVQKRFATVKYMFYDPEDVKWFKPAGLTTKHGLEGKIEESVGEHGTMKCLFNAPIKQHDTVCLCLYKRVYPKLCSARDKDPSEDRTVRTTIGKSSLIVK
jgi:pre-rRNA-processing protein TSR1